MDLGPLSIGLLVGGIGLFVIGVLFLFLIGAGTIVTPPAAQKIDVYSFDGYSSFVGTYKYIGPMAVGFTDQKHYIKTYKFIGDEDFFRGFGLRKNDDNEKEWTWYFFTANWSDDPESGSPVQEETWYVKSVSNDIKYNGRLGWDVTNILNYDGSWRNFAFPYDYRYPKFRVNSLV